MQVLCYAVTLYGFLIFIRIILSWVTMFWSPPHALSPAIRVIYDLTEPALGFFRRYIPPVGGFDFSPIILIVILQIVGSYVCFSG